MAKDFTAERFIVKDENGIFITSKKLDRKIHLSCGKEVGGEHFKSQPQIDYLIMNGRLEKKGGEKKVAKEKEKGQSEKAKS